MKSTPDNMFVSVIIPCKNEAKYIGQCLDSIIDNDYPKDLFEILVIDGMSCDDSRAIVENYAKQNPCIRLLENHKKITPSAFNIGVRHARGEIIAIMSAHAKYDERYISNCVKHLNQYNADNVGGIMKTLPQTSGIFGKAVTLCLSHNFGVGNSFFRVHTDKARWVDTVFGGCYRRDIFGKIGFFNENLTHSQDIEFNRRLKKAGGRTLLAPDIIANYYARTDFVSFCKHNFRNGMWAVLPFIYSDVIPVSLRHLVPLTFVIGLFISAIMAVFLQWSLWCFTGICGTYALANLIASLQVALREKDIRYMMAMPIAFSTLHVLYGLGSVWGIFKMMGKAEFWRKIWKTQ